MTIDTAKLRELATSALIGQKASRQAGYEINQEHAMALTKFIIAHDPQTILVLLDRIEELEAKLKMTRVSDGKCMHIHWAFTTHGRYCSCGIMMQDFGD